MVCGAVSTGSVKKTCRWGRMRRRAAACIRVYAPFGVRGERIHRIHVYKRAGKPLNYVLANCIQKEDGLPRQRARWLAMTEWVMSLLLRWRHKRKPMLRQPPPYVIAMCSPLGCAHCPSHWRKFTPLRWAPPCEQEQRGVTFWNPTLKSAGKGAIIGKAEFVSGRHKNQKGRNPVP